ncbi:MAG TPA: hypothetical protein VH325_17225 [Bryobacteraceae bacterium]|nr:hypothetical protein [Bryobacteraceae bacterium]
MPAPPPFRDTEFSTGWEGDNLHPDAPAGGGGAGFFRSSHSHEEKSLKGGVSEFFDADIHGLEHIGDSVYHVEPDSVHGPTAMEEGCESVFWAAERAKNYAPGAIEETTGFPLHEISDGLIEALLFSLAILVVNTSIGSVAGGVLVGLLSAGTGTAYGVATGASAGLDLGVAILDWLGISFLMPYVVLRLPVVMSPARRGVSLAWVAGRNPLHSSQADIEAAARILSKAPGAFFAVLLQGIVSYVMHETKTVNPNQVVSSESYSDVIAALVTRLRRSRLGNDFATFVQREFPKLLENALQSKRAESPLNL